MKLILLTLLALVGITFASPTAALQVRNPPLRAGSEQARELFELVQKGMLSWGLAGAIHPPSGHISAPSRNLPGGLPEINRPRPPKHKGVPGTPGYPLGPYKKQGRIYNRRKFCVAQKRKRSGIQCPAGARVTTQASRYPKLRLNGQGGVMLAFSTLSPHAHSILEKVKNWDSPIGAAVRWFDESIKGLQEAVGGRYIPEIDGNELKLWLICLFRSQSPQHPDVIDNLCKRYRDEPIEMKTQQQAIDGLNQVADLCQKLEDKGPPMDVNMKREVLALCDKYSKTIEGMVNANAGLILLGEWARARTLNNQDLEESDVVIAQGFIQEGAFGPAIATNETDASATALLYMAHMSSYTITETEENGDKVLIDHTKPPAWFELLQAGASFVPEDRGAINQALKFLDGTPYLVQFDNEGREDRFEQVQTCWSHAGLLMFQPPRWDLIAAAMTYLEGRVRDLNMEQILACMPCLVPSGLWVLRCGSAVP
ncbi:Heat-labile enterotoxin IIA, A chain [Beauveria brongniartii RCEF 3172]|uniref:Heat-labile enterotoxin IIA, A chain n=1 Tax=Beauveria brongniartii RCEF 3172 TaxID=1081107 RepID=A0A162JM56_9HYPO|nr:Heat-labile enterotoxin IIA, A chain [Beauveria brongniartii RCEF 3172]